MDEINIITVLMIYEEEKEEGAHAKGVVFHFQLSNTTVQTHLKKV